MVLLQWSRRAVQRSQPGFYSKSASALTETLRNRVG